MNGQQLPWQGFWQILAADSQEDIQPFRNTTTNLRSQTGFVLYTETYFIELRVLSQMQLPAGWPPTDAELAAMFGSFYGIAGRSHWLPADGGWLGQHRIEMAANPALLGQDLRRMLHTGADSAIMDSDGRQEHWRRLSAAGGTPLCGAWQTENPLGSWLYLACEGHYAVMRSDARRPAPQGAWAELAAEQLLPLAKSFGANAGARLETAGSFDHWPMIGQVAGYDVRKHETFKLEQVNADQFRASLPPLDFPPDEWSRLE